MALVLVVPCDAASHAERTTGTAPHARVPAPARPFGAVCRTVVDGSHVTADCRNPYPETDHVGLHVECERWWDIDADGVRVEAGPAQHVRLTGRCWKEVRSAWITHQR
ncbi:MULTISPECIES: hypothetical protein [Streptomyces]|uniref:Uncharacterized protein n=1 Tax=Streptomyces apricus TaxID=1828112 RepID=A0A5B0AQQ2_9ACTN|nr:hypothetical protein FGF04_21435 [Streptomyces apricus]